MLTIIDSIQEIEKKVNKAFAEELNKALSKNKNEILRKCKEIVTKSILLQPEIQSLGSATVDSLAGQFGLTAAQAAAVPGAISSAVESSVQLVFKPYNASLVGGLEVNFQPNDVNILHCVGKFLQLLELKQ